MPIPFNDSLARLRGALITDIAADEFLAAIQNASVLSDSTFALLANACTSAAIAHNIQNAILGSQTLSPNDLADMQEFLTDPGAGLSYAQLVAGGLTDQYGRVSYPSVPTATAVAPTFSVDAGSYGPAQSVELASTTPGASIFYTVNGATPNTSSTLYTGAISVSSSETVKAIAVKSGFINSSVASAAYVINGAVAALSFSPDFGSYSGTQSVTISSATSGATFRYTLDGSTPTASSTLYSGPVSISVSETLKAIGIKANFVNSSVKTAAYIIT